MSGVSVINSMLKKYPLDTSSERSMAMREVIQEIMLYGLSNSGFFKKAAFTGGTALRICHELDRFSEDLDFSLLSPDASFDLSDYLKDMKNWMDSFGLRFTVEEKDKTVKGNIRTAMAKGNAVEHIMYFFPWDTEDHINPDEKIKIKMEININPPSGATYEIKQRIVPGTYDVRVMDMPSMFACKINAILLRESETRFKNRFKGRDLYDYVFFLQRDTPVNMELARNGIAASGRMGDVDALTKDTLKDMLCDRFREIDYESAKQDMLRFISDPAVFKRWDAEFFTSITEEFLN